ncbi:hypothetical protein [Ruminococcus sp. HUN007]|uniref:hypothetical protein n=1 Tax=Ruminococcus sp. HUN007 TaxID=1514668 RepID=UPI0005D1FC62|nr:hypothetical protein [Ruminococcus sp. HUN007]
MKYKCPYCGKMTYSFLSKMFAGNMTASGRKCPECGRHSVHGLDSTIFSTVVMAAVLISVIMVFRSTHNYLACLGIFAAAYFVCRLADGLFFGLAKNNRNDVW